jgi:hypothetical protein
MPIFPPSGIGFSFLCRVKVAITVLQQSAHVYNVPVGKQFARLSISAGKLVGLNGRFYVFIRSARN